MSSGKRILLITPGFPADESDTTCIPALWTWVKGYAARYPEDELHVIALQYPFHKGEYQFHGVRVTALGGENPTGFAKAWFIFDAIHQVRRIVAQEKPDIIHAFWMNATAFIAWHASGGRFPLLINLMGQDIRPSLWYTLLRRKPVTYIAPSAFSLRALNAILPDAKAHIVHFGMDCPGMPSQTRDIDVLGVGSLIPVKRFRDFVRVVEILVHQGQNIRCELIGDGAERKMLEALITKADVGNYIHINGKQSLNDVYNMMSRSKILLHPSENEGFGMVFAEALCNRMMIVSREVGTAAAAPWWAIAENPEEMAGAITAFLTHPVSVPEEALFSMEKSCAAYHEIYDSVCKR